MMTTSEPRNVALAVVAEDEPVLLIDLVDTLADAGFDVLEATSADEAMRHLSNHPEVGLLVTDVQMPGKMDGFALAREASERWPKLRVVVCSAFTKPQPGQLPEGVRFLDKPYSAELLVKIVRDLGLRV